MRFEEVITNNQAIYILYFMTHLQKNEGICIINMTLL